MTDALDKPTNLARAAYDLGGLAEQSHNLALRNPNARDASAAAVTAAVFSVGARLAEALDADLREWSERHA